MTDRTDETDQAVAPLYPSSTIPTVFVDGVLNFQPGPNVSRFYLARFDPSTNGVGPFVTPAVAQVVMPNLGFAHTAIFFERCLQGLIRDGFITATQVDEIRKSAEEAQSAGPA
jgi:hypothetical protein